MTERLHIVVPVQVDELDRLRLNERRYLYLRDFAVWSNDDGPWCIQWEEGYVGVHERTYPIDGEELDAALDAELASQSALDGDKFEYAGQDDEAKNVIRKV